MLKFICVIYFIGSVCSFPSEESKQGILVIEQPIHNVESNIAAAEGKLHIPGESEQLADDSANVVVENDEKLDSSESFWRLGWSGRGCWNCGYGWGRGFEAGYGYYRPRYYGGWRGGWGGGYGGYGRRYYW